MGKKIRAGHKDRKQFAQGTEDRKNSRKTKDRKKIGEKNSYKANSLKKKQQHSYK